MTTERRGELTFDRSEWAALRAAESVPIHQDDIARLNGINEHLSMSEVEEVYLPLSRLLHLRAGVTRALHDTTGAFLGKFRPHTPFVIGVAGSVAVGKSTAARVLQAMLSRAPERRRVDLVTTDGFLWPTAELTARGLMERKGFPESYDTKSLVSFLASLKAGHTPLHVPLYSHVVYDVLEDEVQEIVEPDIVIVEGINVLQTPHPEPDSPQVFVSDFFDFSIYVDADESDIERWYVDRFLTLVEAARSQPEAFFHQFAAFDAEQCELIANTVWKTINSPNLHENVLPTAARADLVLHKGSDHRVETVRLRTR